MGFVMLGISTLTSLGINAALFGMVAHGLITGMLFFIAGSIKIKHLDRKFKERIDKIIASGFDVVVGDADGADTAIQTYLFAQGSNTTTVYRSGPPPRNSGGNGPTTSGTPHQAPGYRAHIPP